MGMGPPVDEDDEIDFGGGTVPEAVTLFAAMSVQPTQARKTLYNNFIAGLQADGNWDAMDFIHLIAAHDSQAALLNIKSPAAFTMTLGDAPVFEADRGYTTDGTNDYLDTTFNPSSSGGQQAQNSACFAYWQRTNVSMDASGGGQHDGTDGTTIAPRITLDRISFRMNQASAVISGNGTSLISSGLFYANRSGANASQVGRNGVQMNSSAAASTARNNLTYKLGTINLSAFAANQFAGCYGGASRTEAQHLQIYNRFLAYMQGVGAA